MRTKPSHFLLLSDKIVSDYKHLSEFTSLGTFIRTLAKTSEITKISYSWSLGSKASYGQVFLSQAETN